jgi:hypothetical protein
LIVKDINKSNANAFIESLISDKLVKERRKRECEGSNKEDKVTNL